jgi:hypothetical protein
VTTAAEITAALRAASNEEELKAALIRARSQLAKREMKTAELIEAVYVAAKDAAFSYPRPPAGKSNKVKTNPGAEVALLHLTDWQYGKRTSDFNMDVARQRVERAVAKAIDIASIHSTTRPVDTIHVMLGGDMVEGMTIFPGQVYEIEANLFDQMFGVSHLISEAIHTLTQHFKLVHVWEEYGNHGRIGRKDELPGDQNVDRMAYTIARGHFRDNRPQLIWHPVTTWHQIISIGTYRALLVHGDEIRSFGGNHPSYGIVKKVQAWQAGVLDPFRDAYMGHFHRPDTYTLASGGSIYITGSIESGNEYAKEFMAATGRPSQRLHFVDPVAGRVTAEYRLWLD